MCLFLAALNHQGWLFLHWIKLAKESPPPTSVSKTNNIFQLFCNIRSPGNPQHPQNVQCVILERSLLLCLKRDKTTVWQWSIKCPFFPHQLFVKAHCYSWWSFAWSSVINYYFPSAREGLPLKSSLCSPLAVKWKIMPVNDTFYLYLKATKHQRAIMHTWGLVSTCHGCHVPTECRHTRIFLKKKWNQEKKQWDTNTLYLKPFH